VNEDQSALAEGPFVAGEETGEFDPAAFLDESAAEPWESYPWFHFFYAVVALGLVATGLLIQFPDLRARFIGGYGRTVAWLHEWSGVGMLVVPLLALMLAPAMAWETVQLRSWRRDKLWIHAANLWFTIVSGIVFVVSGFLLWFQQGLPDPVIDWSYVFHDIFSYVLYVMIPLHILVSLGRTVRNLRARLGRLRPARTGGQRIERSKASREGLTCW